MRARSVASSEAHADVEAADGGADEDAPRTLVGVSDKMKGKGKQPFTCLEKDQSFHLFQLP